MPTTIISVLVWDSPRYTRNLLDNLAAFNPGRHYHIRFLDQGSAQETRDMIRAFVKGKAHASAEFLTENIGYGAGHNRTFDALWRSHAFDYFVTLNNDLAFGEANWLNTLVDAMEAAPGVGLAGPFCYRMVPTETNNLRNRPATRPEKEAGQFLFVTGAVAIMRVAAIREAGLFDEAYEPAYWEDADLAVRYKACGWSQRFVDVPVVHGYLGTEDRVNAAKRDALAARHGDFMLRNRDLFVSRWLLNRPQPAPADLRQAFPRLYFPPGR